jgi:outer membrane protein OmpA-like peptidoglycan-associated protein
MRLQAAVQTASDVAPTTTMAGNTCARATNPGFNARVVTGRLTPLVMLLALVSCSQPDWSKMNPETWWHNMEGGAIAQNRPPAPGANQPYPNLASVPARPADPDRAALQDITDGLVADRTNAQHVAAAAPLADPSTPSSAPGLFGVGSAQPPGSAPPTSPAQPGVAPGAAATAAAASATLPAASAPPAPATPPAKAPVKEVQSNALPPLSPPPAPAPEPNMPQVPVNPPSPASVAGIPTPPPPVLPNPPASGPDASASAGPSKGPPVSTTPSAVQGPAQPKAPAARMAAATPPPSPAATPSHRPEPAATPGTAARNGAEPVSSGNTVAVVFATGSSDLPPSASGPLRALAARRGNALLTVTGYGDATDASPDAQAAALKLALARAQAIAHALIAAGAPTSAVEVDAQAIGRGGTARLLP